MAGYDRRRASVPAVAGAFFLILAGSLLAEGRKSRWSFGILVENDVFALCDGGYTSGTKFILIPPVRASREESGRFVSFSLGQIISTPENIEDPGLITEDRPYAGVLYAEVGFHKLRQDSMESLEFLLGIAGPSSLAGGIQRSLHKAFGWTYPRGWKNQLGDEALAGCFYDRKWRFGAVSGSSGTQRDFIAHAGGGLSNLWTGLNGGLEFRIGRNLPGDFGPTMIAPAGNAASIHESRERQGPGEGRGGYYFFAALEAHAVARDLLFDGNTLRKSHKVDKLPLTGDIVLGGAFRHKNLKASFSYVCQTKRFTSHKLKPFLGNISLAWNF